MSKCLESSSLINVDQENNVVQQANDDYPAHRSNDSYLPLHPSPLLISSESMLDCSQLDHSSAQLASTTALHNSARTALPLPITTIAETVCIGSQLTGGNSRVRSSSSIPYHIPCSTRYYSSSDARIRKFQFTTNNFLERPRGRLAASYHLAT